MVDRIVSLIKQKGLSISAVEKQLGFGNGAIKRFATSSPSADKIIALSNFLNVPTDYLLFGEIKNSSSELTEDEQELLTYYKNLDIENRIRVKERAETLLDLNSSKTPIQTVAEPKLKVDPEEQYIYVELYDMPASAGCGVLLASGASEPIKIRRSSITEKANFALEVRGESMEPEFYNKDIVLIRSQPCIEIGDIGIFVVNGNGYIKKFGGDRLISINSEYKDLLLHEYDSIYCKGKVLGILEDDDILE